jgi:hypothetical protein
LGQLLSEVTSPYIFFLSLFQSKFHINLDFFLHDFIVWVRHFVVCRIVRRYVVWFSVLLQCLFGSYWNTNYLIINNLDVNIVDPDTWILWSLYFNLLSVNILSSYVINLSSYVINLDVLSLFARLVIYEGNEVVSLFAIEFYVEVMKFMLKDYIRWFLFQEI